MRHPLERSRRRPRRSLPAAVGLTLALLGGRASADEDDGPWGRGTVVPSLGFGASFGPDMHRIDIGAGAAYFVLPGLGLGLDVSNTVLIYRSDFRERFPGIERETPSNIVRLIPNVQYIFARKSRFSPYIRGGLGPVFYNRGRGTVGQWVVGPGMFIDITPSISIAVGVDFFANFPDSAWQEAFSYQGQSIRGCALVSSPCSFQVSPRLGLMFRIPTRRTSRDDRPRERAPQPPAYTPPPSPPSWEREPGPPPDDLNLEDRGPAGIDPLPPVEPPPPIEDPAPPAGEETAPAPADDAATGSDSSRSFSETPTPPTEAPAPPS